MLPNTDGTTPILVYLEFSCNLGRSIYSRQQVVFRSNHRSFFLSFRSKIEHPRSNIPHSPSYLHPFFFFLCQHSLNSPLPLHLTPTVSCHHRPSPDSALTYDRRRISMAIKRHLFLSSIAFPHCVGSPGPPPLQHRWTNVPLAIPFEPAGLSCACRQTLTLTLLSWRRGPQDILRIRKNSSEIKP